MAFKLFHNRSFFSLLFFFLFQSSFQVFGQTTLQPGDLAVVGVNASNVGCGGISTEDLISYVCFKDITPGTVIDLTDNGWERLNPGLWGDTEGTIRMTYSGGGIPAGEVITISAVNTPETYNCISHTGWSFVNINPVGFAMNLNSGGDQIYFMQNGNWTVGSPVPSTHDASYSGTILFGFNTQSTWNANGTSQQSNLHPSVTPCFHMEPSVGQTDFLKYTGPMTAATQLEWIDRIGNSSNWTAFPNCGAYNAAAPNYPLPISLPISPSGISLDCNVCSGCGTVNDILTFNLPSFGGPFNIVYTDGITNFNLFGTSNGHTVPVTVTATTTFEIVSITDVNGCPVFSNFEGDAIITVNPAPPPPVPTSNSPICEGDDLMLDGPFVAGATYSWTGPNSFTSSFEDPIITNVTSIVAGVYTLTISIGGCAGSSGTVSVSTVPSPTANSASLSACDTGGGLAIFDLTTVNNTINGGTGSAVIWYLDAGGIVQVPLPAAFPSTATSVYAAVSNGVCESSLVEVPLTVLTAGMPNLGSTSICAGDPPINLIAFQDPLYPNGTWSGTGVSGILFNPSNLSGGITLTFTPNDPCAVSSTTTITVNAGGTPILSTAAICDDNGLYDLTQLQDPAFPNGTWSGQGVIGTFFNPAGLTSIISLTFTPSGLCEQTAFTTIEVSIAGQPNLGMDAVCDDSGPYNLFALQDPAFPVGTWSGQGVNAGFFTPTGLSGPITISFAPTGNCVQPAFTTIDVTTAQTPSLCSDAICDDNGLFDLTELEDLNFPNGTWTGQGVVGTFFDPNNLTGMIMLTFTPDGTCVNAATTFLDVLITQQPVLESDAICDDSGLYDLTQLQDPAFNSGDWSGQNVTNNEFNPAGLNGNIQVTFTSNEDCVDPATTTINVSTTQTPVLSTVDVCENSGIYNLNNLLDPAFPDGTWAGQNVTGNDFDPFGLDGGIILSFTSSDNCVNIATTTINVTPTGNPNLGSTALCQDDGVYDLEQLVDPVIPHGTWSGQGVNGTNFDPNNLNGSIDLTFTPDDLCAEIAMTAINVASAPSFINLTEDCDPTNANYTVTFEITGGDSNTYTIDGSSVTGNTFTSTPIISGDNYSFQLDDGNNCGPIEISGLFNCLCVTNAGTMNPPFVPLKICDGESFSVVHNGDETLDQNDLLHYVLHDNPGTQLGNVLATSNTTNFDFPAGIVFGQTYYVSAIAGSDDGSGVINTSDGCLSVAQGISVEFYQLSASLSEGASICENECHTFTFSMNGVPSYDVIYQISTINDIIQDTLTTASNDVTLTICPADYNITSGPIQVEILELYDVNCYEDLSGTGSEVIMINPIPVTQFSPTICESESFIINGTIYDFDSPIGTETLSNASFFGCDSTVNINLNFYQPAEFDLNQTLCEGGSIMVNGNVYDETSPSGTELIPLGSINGCDSIINIELEFNSSIIENFTPTLCDGESVTINGNVYDAITPTGTETFPLGSYLGCDSTVVISLNILDPVVFDLIENACEDDTLIVNGTIFDINNPMGTEVIVGGSYMGCDSTINVVCTFFEPVIVSLNETLCEGGSITVNGIEYNELNPTGTEVMEDASENGCDSTVIIDLIFNSEVFFDLNQELCEGESIMVNGNPYDQITPSGTETIIAGSYLGCDSTINIDLSFIPASTFDLSEDLCEGGSIMVNGNTYDEGNTSGVEIFGGAAFSGCDSIVNVNVTFHGETSFDFEETLCPGEFLFINGTIYNEGNLNGEETLIGANEFGCDSIVDVSLTYYPEAEFNLTQELCTGGSVTVNGTVYDESSPNGTEILIGESQYGCDSIVNISLNFSTSVTFNLVPTLCPNESVIVNGSTYDINIPFGTETFPMGSYLGCDSIVNVSLNFWPLAESFIDETLCDGESLIINGETFDQTNPSGTQILQDFSHTECDSFIHVNLSFIPPAEGFFDEVLCDGGSVVINGTIYDETNSSGIEIFENGSVDGCDSILNIQLDFDNEVVFNLNQTLCDGESIILNGTQYNQANSSGSELFPNGSFFGCDSLVNISLSFFQPIITSIQELLTSGQSITVNGTVYNENNPSGTEVIINGAANGCDSTIIIDLSFGDLMLLVEEQAPDCYGDSNGVVILHTIMGGEGPFNYSFNGQDFLPVPNLPLAFENLAGGLYQIIIQDALGSEVTLLDTLPSPQELILDLGEDVTIRPGESWQFIPLLNFPPLSWEWEPKNLLDCENCLYVNAFSLEESATFNLTILDENGCTVSDTVNITVYKEPSIYVPNVFSPNFDGTNDRLRISGGENVLNINTFKIFSRWGELIYQADNFSPDDQFVGWDGLYQGQEMDIGVYVYLVEVLYDDGSSESIGGDVLLLR